jgi:hypothetical protein
MARFRINSETAFARLTTQAADERRPLIAVGFTGSRDTSDFETHAAMPMSRALSSIAASMWAEKRPAVRDAGFTG